MVNYKALVCRYDTILPKPQDDLSLSRCVTLFDQQFRSLADAVSSHLCVTAVRWAAQSFLLHKPHAHLDLCKYESFFFTILNVSLLRPCVCVKKERVGDTGREED